jgi:myo-inositol-1(or 4)-monophosphatase
MDLEKVTRKVCQLSEEVAGFIKSAINQVSSDDIVTKDLNSLVTYVDRQAEQRLVTGLKQILPEAGFITEEETIEQDENAHLKWIIDPLDGTTNYLHGLPFYSVSVALRKGPDYLSGVICEVDRGHLFYAWKGGGAWEDQQRIQVSPTPLLSDALLATGFPYARFDMVEKYLNLFRDLFPATRGIRRIGSAALDLAYTAKGSFDAFFEYGLNEWDIAAGICVVREAGGQVTNFEGTGGKVSGSTILASNGKLHEAMLTHIRNHF